MAQFDLHPAPSGSGYVLDVQADLLEMLNTRVVVPILPETEAPPPARGLNPVFALDGGRHVMVTQYLSAVRRSGLARPVGSLAGARDDITRALDLLTHGI